MVARLTHIVFRDAAGKRVDAGRLGESAVRRCAFRILEENVLCSIATVTSPRRAHINTAHFCYSNRLTLYFLSHPNARHCRNLLTHSSAAITVFSSDQRWGTPGRGVQLFGTCRRTSGVGLREAERSYAKRFPRYLRWKAGAARAGVGAEYRFYRFEVSRLKLMDEGSIGDGIVVSADVNRSA